MLTLCSKTGFPRAWLSAEHFEKAVAPITKFIVLDVPEDILIARCRLRSRADDDDETIRKRIVVYNTKCAYVIQKYSEKGKVSRVFAPSNKLVLGAMALFSSQMGDYLPLDIPEAVYRNVVYTGLILWKFFDIRDGGNREFPYF